MAEVVATMAPNESSNDGAVADFAAAAAAAAAPAPAGEKDPTSCFVGSKVARDFDGEIFTGTISEYFPEEDGSLALWHVKYADGDEEDYDIDEVEKALELFHASEDSPRKRRRTSMKLFECKYSIGQPILKHFPGYGKFRGAVKELPNASLPYYDVVYTDGDSEHIHIDQIHKYIVEEDDEDCDSHAAPSHSRQYSRKKLAQKQADEVELRCIMCLAHGRPKTKFDTSKQLLPVRLKLKSPHKGAAKETAGYIHACCALRSPPPSPVNEQKSSVWWTEVSEKTHGHPGLPAARRDSTSSDFIPYPLSFSDWVDEFALYNYR